MTTTTDIAQLCAAIDAGDDSALPALADAMEEAGDPRAAGLRQLGDRWPVAVPVWGGDPGYRWYRATGGVDTPCLISEPVWLQLRFAVADRQRCYSRPGCGDC